MTYDEAISYITGALKFGINPGLEKISRACSALGDPHERYPVIQITGTNGKTSVARMVSAILREHGFRAGLYTSPHLSFYNERISVEGSPISDEDFARAVGEVKEVLDAVSASMGELTEFEILTASALHHFSTVGVGVAVLEVGLGGRWDATSVTKPQVSVVTNVELDHTDRLGETIAEIAWDKAHIIKGGKVIGGDLSPEALRVVEERCFDVGSPLKLLGRDFRVDDFRPSEGSAHVEIQGIYRAYPDLELNVMGDFQQVNAGVAIAACEAFTQGPLSPSVLAKALGEVSCPGRMEKISHEPVVLVDGAHNPAGMRRLVGSLRRVYGERRRLVVVFSASSDKDVEGMLIELSSAADRLILTQNASYRSATVEELAARAGSLTCEFEPDLPRAMERAAGCVGDGVVVVTGSLYTVGEAREYWYRSKIVP